MAKTERQVTTTNRETELVMVPIEDPRIQTLEIKFFCKITS